MIDHFITVNSTCQKPEVLYLKKRVNVCNILTTKFSSFFQNGLPDTQAKFHIMFLFFAAAMFSISLSSLFGYHCWLVSKNKSTLGK